MRGTNRYILYGIIIAIIFVTVGTFILYESNETLDMVAEYLGAEGLNILPAPFPDYTVPWLDNIWGGLALGILSTLLIFAVTYGLGKVLTKIRARNGKF
ncbi:MAG: hypothetical protein ACUVQ5_00290 [Candidatus Methanomethylicaceae archaeon]